MSEPAKIENNLSPSNDEVTLETAEEISNNNTESQMEYIRSKNKGCFILAGSPAWGYHLSPIEDPDGIEVSATMLENLRLIDNFPKLPMVHWSRILKLYFELCDPNNKSVDTTAEASVLFLRKEADGFKTWRVLVPTQEVGSGSVKAKFDKCCDIETGEEITQFPPPGWVHVGSSHSHNTMGAFFSKTDDDNELSVPGMHIVAGTLNRREKEYTVAASIVLKGKRWPVNIEDVVDVQYDVTIDEVDYHPNVLQYIKKFGYSNSSTSTTTPNTPSSTETKESKTEDTSNTTETKTDTHKAETNVKSAAVTDEDDTTELAIMGLEKRPLSPTTQEPTTKTIIKEVPASLRPFGSLSSKSFEEPQTDPAPMTPVETSENLSALETKNSTINTHRTIDEVEVPKKDSTETIIQRDENSGKSKILAKYPQLSSLDRKTVNKLVAFRTLLEALTEEPNIRPILRDLVGSKLELQEKTWTSFEG